MLRLAETCLALLATLSLCLTGVGGLGVCIHACGHVDLGAPLALAGHEDGGHAHGASEHCVGERPDPGETHAEAAAAPGVGQPTTESQHAHPEQHTPEVDPCVDVAITTAARAHVQLSKVLELPLLPCPLEQTLAAPDHARRVAWPGEVVAVSGHPEFLRNTVLLL